MQTPELEKVVDEIKAGKRVVLYPPGAITLPILILLAVAALVTCVASLSHYFAHDMTIDQKIALQIGSIIPLFLGAIFPGLMISSGRKQFASWIRIYMAAVGLIATSALAWALVRRETEIFPLIYVAIVSSACGFAITLTAQFTLLCEFFYLLKRKK